MAVQGAKLKASPVGSMLVQLLGTVTVLAALYTSSFAAAPLGVFHDAVVGSGWFKFLLLNGYLNVFGGGGADAAANSTGADVDAERGFHTLLCFVVLAFMGTSFFILLAGVPAWYGRYSTNAGGPLVPNRLGWVVQEVPVCAWGYWLFSRTAFDPFQSKTATIVACMLLLHYANRTFVFPFRLRSGKPTPLEMIVLAHLFCVCNGFVQLKYLEAYATYDDEHFEYFSPRFVLGTFLFFLGMAINTHSDDILMNLRKPGDTGYYIPRGGFFTLLSGANFFGEVVEWIGFAVAANSLPAWTFAIGTFCNLAPRAYMHHKWYLKKFDNYPPERRAFLPFVW